MKGAARRGTCLGKLPLGFTRQVCRDANGDIVRRPDGRPRHKPCCRSRDQAVPGADVRVVRPTELVAVQDRQALQPAPSRRLERLDRLRHQEAARWGSTPSASSSGTAIGGSTTTSEEKYVTVENPRSEWEIYKDPSLAIVPKELWRAAWLKLLRTRKAHPLTGKKWSRNQNSATTLFSGTLFCEHCEARVAAQPVRGEVQGACPASAAPRASTTAR